MNGGHFFLVRRLLKECIGEVLLVIDEADSTIYMLMDPVKVPTDVTSVDGDIDTIYDDVLNYLKNSLKEVRSEIKVLVKRGKRLPITCVGLS